MSIEFRLIRSGGMLPRETILMALVRNLVEGVDTICYCANNVLTPKEEEEFENIYRTIPLHSKTDRTFMATDDFFNFRSSLPNTFDVWRGRGYQGGTRTEFNILNGHLYLNTHSDRDGWYTSEQCLYIVEYFKFCELYYEERGLEFLENRKKLITLFRECAADNTSFLILSYHDDA